MHMGAFSLDIIGQIRRHRFVIPKRKFYALCSVWAKRQFFKAVLYEHESFRHLSANFLILTDIEDNRSKKIAMKFKVEQKIIVYEFSGSIDVNQSFKWVLQ
jgi:hypothetical protein